MSATINCDIGRSQPESGGANNRSCVVVLLGTTAGMKPQNGELQTTNKLNKGACSCYVLLPQGTHNTMVDRARKDYLLCVNLALGDFAAVASEGVDG